MKRKTTYILSTCMLSFASLFLHAEEEDSIQNKEKPKSCNTTQDLYVGTSLAKDNMISPYIELDMGYRHDSIHTSQELLSSIYDLSETRNRSLNLFQLDVKSGMRFLKYLFLKTDFGFGFFGSAKDNETSYLSGTDVQVSGYEISFKHGWGFDALVGGGVHIPIYTKHLAIDPEIGYDYKTIKITNSCKFRISSPYAGGTFYFSPGQHLSVAFFGAYFFSPSAHEESRLYLPQSNTFLDAPEVRTSHDITAYKLAASIAYLFYKHFSVSFDWQYFHGKVGTVTGDFGDPFIGFSVSQTLNSWTSNQYELGMRYSF